MNRLRRLFYKDVEGKVNDLLEYVADLEKSEMRHWRRYVYGMRARR